MNLKNFIYFPKISFDYKFILEKLNSVYNGFQYSNQKYEVSKYIKLWNLSGNYFYYKNNKNSKENKLKQISINLFRRLNPYFF